MCVIARMVNLGRGSSFMRLKETEREDLGPGSFELLVRLGRGAFGEALAG